MFEEILSPLFTTEWGKRSSIGILVLTTGMLFYVLINVSLTLYRQFNLSSPSVTPVIAHADLTQLIIKIPEWHLFGGGADDVLPLTSLQIHLTGIITDHSGNASRAIISEGDNRGKIYQTGDVLESGVHLYAITADGVVLENGGQLEKLPLRVPHQESESSVTDAEANNSSADQRED